MQTPHDLKVGELVNRYIRLGYTILLDSGSSYNIPDILAITPRGKVVWVEVETNLSEQDKKRFSLIRKKLKRAKGRFKLVLLTKTEINEYRREIAEERRIKYA